MILHGDCLEELNSVDDNSIDLVCTDPPYGYSFMGKDWDRAVPSVEIWKECLRVLKPGAFMCVMSAPRSDVQNAMISRLMEAGFRLDFTPIYWTYASGFPKAGNIGKLVDKRLGVAREVIGHTANARPNRVGRPTNLSGLQTIGGEITEPQSDEAKSLDGSYAGFQPKPAVEVIIVAMKPLSEKTYVDQALANGHGISWLDDGRIPGAPPAVTGQGIKTKAWREREDRTDVATKTISFIQPQGRFPANLLVSDDVLNDGRNIKSGGTVSGNEPSATTTDIYGKFKERKPYKSPNDSGSYSRYFDLDKWYENNERINYENNTATELELPNKEQSMARQELLQTGVERTQTPVTLPFLICSKASKSEKNRGLDCLPDIATRRYGERGQGKLPQQTPQADIIAKNHHPTVKPLKLMSYLITLFSRSGDTVLDPFVGSGTTCLAAKELGREYIGIEREAEYVEITKARLNIETQEALLGGKDE